MADTFDVTLHRLDGYRFEVDFGPTMLMLETDEPLPLGEGAGPNPTRILAAAIGNCLAASLLFCLQKSRVQVGDIAAHVSGTIVRNERGRLRVGRIHVSLAPELEDGDARAARCMELFRDFCIVTESVQAGIPIEVTVQPRVAAGTPG